ncbi:histidine phosphatase family protein [Maribacter sp. ACAM166]|uniref:histidine phosphatase family protein n=1 Tax=Maribacter sp. ACAM166 TaxID=2508996 RepID=UPI0010FDC88E|nr:histidine phosphatase family protein [Maribacter sp. ACAM166]TLP70540.1 histidine phosphatase family protein [Maribacter sp. ACAM166]
MHRKKILFITHANVDVNPKLPVPDWGLSVKGKERHVLFNFNPEINNISAVYSSYEQKAIDGGKILSNHLSIELQKVESLKENDRSSTGFLYEEEFQTTANIFFAKPYKSVRGWERAIDAQNRIVSAIKTIISNDKSDGDIAIVAHGGVGTLLFCSLKGEKISRQYDQPSNGGGNFFTFYKENFEILHNWRDISLAFPA